MQTLRKTSTGMGTFAYAAPELLEGKPDRTSDQYCLAISYIELCSGELPFEETNPLKVVDLHRRGELDLSRLEAKECEVVRKAVSVDPILRWPSCTEMVRALRRASEGSEISLPTEALQRALRRGEGRGEVPLSATPPSGTAARPAAQRLDGGDRRLLSGGGRHRSHGRGGHHRPARTSPLSPPASRNILLSLLAVAVCAAAAWFFWPKSTIEEMIEKKIQSGEIAKAVEYAADAKKMDFFFDCWSKTIVKFVEEDDDFAKAFARYNDYAGMPSADRSLCQSAAPLADLWSRRIEKLAGDNQFRAAYEVWMSARRIGHRQTIDFRMNFADVWERGSKAWPTRRNSPRPSMR